MIKQPINLPIPPLLLSLSPEVQLLVCCARVEQIEPFRTYMSILIRNGVDWHETLSLASRHGMIGLLYTHLSKSNQMSIPEKFLSQLQRQNKAYQVQQLILTARMLKISKLLDSANIYHLHYKGIVLDHQIYGGQLLRPTSDMDILVYKEDIFRIKSLLADEGYILSSATTPVQESIVLKRGKDYVFKHPNSGHIVEVHWSLLSQEFGANFDIEAFDPTDKWLLQIADTELQTFNATELLMVLCIHGSKHQFSSLKWLCDLVQLTILEPYLDWNTALERTRHIGLERTVLISADLLHRLTGSHVPLSLLDLINANPQVKAYTESLCNQLHYNLTQETSSMQRLRFHLKLFNRWQGKLRYLLVRTFHLQSRDIANEYSGWIQGISNYPMRVIYIVKRLYTG